MPDVVDRMGAALLDASLAATAITGLVVLAMIQCRQPARRRDWARLGLLSTLALLPLAALNPVPRLDLRGTLRSILPTDLDDPPPPPRSLDPSRSPFAATRPPPEAEDACAQGPPRMLRQVARGMVFVYAAGVSAGLGWIALGLLGTAWLVRRGGSPSAASLAHYRSLPFAKGPGRPRLLVSDRATRPALVGFSRPAILIPEALDDPDSKPSSGPLRLSLLHELAHAENLDHRFSPAAALAQAVWFFLPPVWWIRDQMKLDQEFLADRRAAEHFGTSGGYASSLVELAAGGVPDRDGARSSSTTPERPAPSGGAGVASALFQRVVMLLKCPFPIEGQTPLWWRWSTAATLALATLAASCLTLRGLAGWSDPPASSADEGPRSFRLPQLTIQQRDHDDQPFDLRFRLPDQFALTFEVMAEPSDLPTIEVLGHRLGPLADPDPSRPTYRLWHRVRIARSPGSENVEVDGRPLPSDTRPARPAQWLTVRPSPGRTVRLRDLELTW